MINKGLIIFSLLCLSPLNVIAESYQGNAELGPLKTPSCRFCHGFDGIAVHPDYPNLQGQKEGYLFTAMKAYKNGERTGDLAQMMRQQLSRLNDQDLADIAAYYASKKEL